MPLIAPVVPFSLRLLLNSRSLHKIQSPTPFARSQIEKHQMMEKKPSTTSSVSSFSLFFKRQNKKGSGGGAWLWKLKSSAGLRWKKRFNLHLWFVDYFLFKIISIFEGIFLVSTLCVFFLCCGCHF